MRLNTHDTIQIEGLHPTHPITGRVLPHFLQYFEVTRPQDGDTIDPTALWPACDEQAPIRMERVHSVNMRPPRH